MNQRILWRQRCGAWAKFRAANLELQKSAQKEMRRALRLGLITRDSCAVCGDERSEGHHEDYAKPLTVVWLCRFHHSHRHQGASVEQMRAWGAAA